MEALATSAVKLLSRFSSDKRGVVSFEYVIVAAVVVGAVGLAFGNSSTGIQATLTSAISAIGSTINSYAG